jgi:hypothetical protein
VFVQVECHVLRHWFHGSADAFVDAARLTATLASDRHAP